MGEATNRKPPPKGRGGKKGQKQHTALTATDRVFITDYLKHGDAAHAYLAAGFNGNNPGPNGYKMLHKGAIQRFLNTVERKAIFRASKKLEITVDKVLEDIEEARVLALSVLPSPQCAAAIKASELHGRHLGMFRDDYSDREQIPLISITTGDGTRIAMMSREQAALISPLPLLSTPNPLPQGIDEVLTDDDFL